MPSVAQSTTTAGVAAGVADGVADAGEELGAFVTAADGEWLAAAVDPTEVQPVITDSARTRVTAATLMVAP